MCIAGAVASALRSDDPLELSRVEGTRIAWTKFGINWVVNVDGK